MVKNAFAVLMCSRSAVMFYAGDEFCNTQFGNNNAYCQDNDVSWLDWNRLKKYREVHDFVSALIAFRMKHDVIRHKTEPPSFGFPDISVHNTFAWNNSFRDDDHLIAVMFAGRDKKGRDDAVFIAVNSYWEYCRTQLPGVPLGYQWNCEFYTYVPYHKGEDLNAMIDRSGDKVAIAPRSVMIFSLKSSSPQQGA